MLGISAEASTRPCAEHESPNFMVSSLLAVGSDKEWALASEDCAMDANTHHIMTITERLKICVGRSDDYVLDHFQDVYFDNGTIVQIESTGWCVDHMNSGEFTSHSAPAREAMGKCALDDREFVTVLEDYMPDVDEDLDPAFPLKKGMRGVVLGQYHGNQQLLIMYEGIPWEQAVTIWDGHPGPQINIERDSRVDCSLSVSTRFQECCQSGKKFCYAARVDRLECNTGCTAQGRDPWSTGHEVACCDGLSKQRFDWDGDGNFFWHCTPVQPDFTV